MEGNPNTNNHFITQLVTNFEAMSRSGDLSFLHEKDFFELIQYYEDEFNFDKALEVTDLAVERFGFIAELYIKKAQILMSLKNTSEAYEALDQAAVLSPVENEIMLLKANCLIMDRAYDEAFKILHEVMMSGSLSEMIKASLLKASAHEMLKDYNAMFSDIRFVLDRQPGNEPAMEKLWSYMESNRSYHQGITYLHTLLNEDPYAYLAWYNLGQAYACIGEYENAILAYEYSFIIQPGFELGYKDCADLAMQMCRYKFALQVYVEALENIGPDAELFANIGECYIQLKQYRQARLNLRKANRLDPYNDEVNYNLGLCFAAEQKWDIAIQHYYKALKIEDSREEYFAAVAEAFYKLGDPDKANYYFTKATDLGGDIPEIWLSHAKFLFEINEYDKSMEVLEAADDCTYSADLLYAGAACLLALDRREEAIDRLKEALVEDFESHRSLFQFNSELREDQEIISLVHYFSPKD